LVSESGGDARVLTIADTAKGELGHWWPQILPDGDHVIFTAYRTPIDQATIEVLSIKTGERKVLIKGGVYGLYVPTGHLLYAVGETIRAVPFDLKGLAVTGAAIPVVDSVAMNPIGWGRRLRRLGERNPRLPAGQLVRHRNTSDAGRPARARNARAARS
jgi:hypothetical protein